MWFTNLVVSGPYFPFLVEISDSFTENQVLVKKVINLFLNIKITFSEGGKM